jgi:hypothetical protein
MSTHGKFNSANTAQRATPSRHSTLTRGWDTAWGVGSHLVLLVGGEGPIADAPHDVIVVDRLLLEQQLRQRHHLQPQPSKIS